MTKHNSRNKQQIKYSDPLDYSNPWANKIVNPFDPYGINNSHPYYSTLQQKTFEKQKTKSIKNLFNFSASVGTSVAVGFAVKSLVIGGAGAVGLSAGYGIATVMVASAIANGVITTGRYALSKDKKIGSKEYYNAMKLGMATSAITGGVLAGILPLSGADEFIQKHVFDTEIAQSAKEAVGKFFSNVASLFENNSNEIKTSTETITSPKTETDFTDTTQQTEINKPSIPEQTNADITESEKSEKPDSPETDQETPYEIPEPTAEEILTDKTDMVKKYLEGIAEDGSINTDNPQYQEIIKDLDSTDPKTVSQALKDLADGFGNGNYGITENDQYAVALAKFSLNIDPDNLQAQAFVGYHALHGLGTGVDIETAKHYLTNVFENANGELKHESSRLLDYIRKMPISAPTIA